jgi:hypothetical protein
MSTLAVDQLWSNSKNGIIKIGNRGHIKQSGMIVQVKEIASITRQVYTSPTASSTEITALSLTIAPLYSTSTLILQWTINGEAGEDNVFSVMRNGSVITDASYQGYNSNSTSAWSGLTSWQYDRNNDSTPSNMFMQYFIPAGSTTSRTYSPGVRSNNGAAQSFYLNRTVASNGAENYELLASTGIVMEVAA